MSHSTINNPGWLQAESAYFKQEFQFYYQPVFSLRSLRLHSLKALLCWQTDRAQIYAPSSINIVEESQLEIPLCELIFYEACKQIKLWQLYHLASVPFQLSINPPSKQLCQTNFYLFVEKTLGMLSLRPDYLQIEIPVEWILQNSSAAKTLIVQLTKMGVSVCIDNLELPFLLSGFWKSLPVRIFKLSKNGARLLLTDLDFQNNLNEILLARKTFEVIVPVIENEIQLDSIRKLDHLDDQYSFFSQSLSSRQATELICSHVRQQPKDLLAYVLGMNILSQVAERCLGKATVIRYWKATRPRKPWLALIEPYQKRQALFNSRHSSKLGIDKQQDLRQWMHQFTQHCSLIIKDFHYLLIQAKLTTVERRLLRVLCPNLFSE